MMRINLIPAKSTRKQTQARLQLSIMGGALGALVVILWIVHLSVSMQLDRTERLVSEVKSDLGKLEKEVNRVKQFRARAGDLESKLQAIEVLGKKRSGPAMLLDDLATILTDHRKVWLTEFSEKENKATLRGAAMDHENISAFQVALEASRFFEGVTLQVVTRKEETKSEVSVVEFVLTCDVNYAAG